MAARTLWWRAGIAILVIFDASIVFRVAQALVRHHPDTEVFWGAIALLVIVFLVVMFVIARLWQRINPTRTSA